MVGIGFGREDREEAETWAVGQRKEETGPAGAPKGEGSPDLGPGRGLRSGEGIGPGILLGLETF